MVLTLAALGLVVAVSVVGLGLYNVSARAGHLPGVSWVLHTTFRNSVDLRAPPQSEAPDLTDPDLIALGAGHFDVACRMCHAAPGETRAATVRTMVPEPPHITEAVESWNAGELFWIVREGVKMSGMPAWPAPSREDEVWAVVAFLTSVGDMSGESYDALTAQPETERAAVAFCATCHGSDGMSGNAQIPRLDIQNPGYLLTALQAFRNGMRASGIMQQAASLVPEATLAELADHYGAQPTGEASAEVDPALSEAGEALAEARTGDTEVPACRACHGPWPERLSPDFPALAGQHEHYLRKQLSLWKEGRRGGGPRSDLMHQAAADLTEDEIAALAAYYASLPPARLGATEAAAR
ncbi:c-type cytochrome [Rhodobacteraceae bacterium MCCB 386]|nr:c-type cytochrome [Roseitranquillus sediminis]MBM9596176.1 c-type cytochrome [Roseitranquillus sediminis]